MYDLNNNFFIFLEKNYLEMEIEFLYIFLY